MLERLAFMHHILFLDYLEIKVVRYYQACGKVNLNQESTGGLYYELI